MMGTEEISEMYRNGYNKAMEESNVRVNQVLEKNAWLEGENQRLRDENKELRCMIDDPKHDFVELGDVVESDGYMWVVISKDEEGCLTMLGSDGITETVVDRSVNYSGCRFDLETMPFMAVLRQLSEYEIGV